MITSILLILMTFTQFGRAGETMIAPAVLPSAILKHLNEAYPTGTVTKAKREEKKGRVEFEVELCNAGRAIEIEYDGEGQVTEVEDEGGC